MPDFLPVAPSCSSHVVNTSDMDFYQSWETVPQLKRFVQPKVAVNVASANLATDLPLPLKLLLSMPPLGQPMPDQRLLHVRRMPRLPVIPVLQLPRHDRNCTVSTYAYSIPVKELPAQKFFKAHLGSF